MISGFDWFLGHIKDLFYCGGHYSPHLIQTKNIFWNRIIELKNELYTDLILWKTRNLRSKPGKPLLVIKTDNKAGHEKVKRIRSHVWPNLDEGPSLRRETSSDVGDFRQFPILSVLGLSSDWRLREGPDEGGRAEAPSELLTTSCSCSRIPRRVSRGRKKGGSRRFVFVLGSATDPASPRPRHDVLVAVSVMKNSLRHHVISHKKRSCVILLHQPLNCTNRLFSFVFLPQIVTLHSRTLSSS